MSMRLVEVPERYRFDEKVLHPLQSWQWGEFRKESGNGVIRFVNAHKKNIIESYQLLTHKIPFSNLQIGTLIKCPKPTKDLFPFLRKLAKENRLLFIKLEPNFAVSLNSKLLDKNSVSKIRKLLLNNKCTRGKTLFTPSSFWIDLTLSEEELLKSFSPKTRYNIRLAKRHGVRVKEDNSSEAFEKYIELTFETAKRQGFYAHTEEYHRLMWKCLRTDLEKQKSEPIAHLFTTTYNKEIVTTWILFVWKDFLYYPYGASSGKYKNVMSNNLIMWEAIKFGKKLGLKTFDLWGREEGKGFTKFKEGYNPNVVEFLGSWDFVINKPIYFLYRGLEYCRWKILKFPSKLKSAIKI